MLRRIRDSGRRTVKADYLGRRRETKSWLIAERLRLSGETPQARPVYGFLGDFADGLDASRPRSLVIPLDTFVPDSLTFTYPDCMTSLPLGMRPDLAPERRLYHGHVFTLSQIRAVVGQYGLPERVPRMHARFDRFIEVQIWDDGPIRTMFSASAGVRHLGRTATG